MKIVRTDDIIGTDREVTGPGWTSRRLLVRRDGMGFSVHETIVPAGAEMKLWYKNHLEAVLCIEGEGEIEEVPGGKVHRIEPGMLYALDQHDRHLLRGKTRMRMICVFNPPLTGREVHDAEGVYPLVEDEEASAA